LGNATTAEVETLLRAGHERVIEVLDEDEETYLLLKRA
jgi:hypothetical protein